jgi:hypothetical protein
VDEKHTKGADKKPASAIEDALSLPPATKAQHHDDGPPRDPNAPSGSLPSDDAEVVPVDFSPPR